MKLYQIICWGVVSSGLGYILVKLIWGEPFTFEDFFTRAFFLTAGILAGWYFKGKEGIHEQNK